MTQITIGNYVVNLEYLKKKEGISLYKWNVSVQENGKTIIESDNFVSSTKSPKKTAQHYIDMEMSD